MILQHHFIFEFKDLKTDRNLGPGFAFGVGDDNDLARVYSDPSPILDPAKLADMEAYLGSKPGNNQIECMYFGRGGSGAVVFVCVCVCLIVLLFMLVSPALHNSNSYSLFISRPDTMFLTHSFSTLACPLSSKCLVSPLYSLALT